MGYLAAKTERVQIAAGILPIYSRTPTLIAMTAAGLDALSGGRFVLGLGASGPQVIEGFHGVPYDRPLGRTREIVDICRTVWKRDDKLVHDGPIYHVPLPPGEGTGLGKPLKIINHPVRPSIPIYLASLGEKNVALTAEIADGWLPLFFVPDKAKEAFGAVPRRPARPSATPPWARSTSAPAASSRSARSPRSATCATSPVPTWPCTWAAWVRASRTSTTRSSRRYGWEAEAAEIQDLFLAGKKAEAEAAVPAELLELTNLVGPESYVKERLAAFREAGVTVLNITPLGPDPTRTVEQLKTWTAEPTRSGVGDFWLPGNQKFPTPGTGAYAADFSRMCTPQAEPRPMTWARPTLAPSI